MSENSRAAYLCDSGFRLRCKKNTDFDVGPLRLHQFADDLAEFVGMGELPLGGGARRGRQGRHGARREGGR